MNNLAMEGAVRFLPERIAAFSMDSRPSGLYLNYDCLIARHSFNFKAGS